MATFRDLLAAAKAEISEVDTAGRRSAHRRRCARARRPRARRVRGGRDARCHPHPAWPPRGAGREPHRSTRPRRSSSTAPVACASAFAAKTLQELGYTDVVSMAGGFGRGRTKAAPWKHAGRRSPPTRSNRYKRHLLLPEVGTAGQVKLLEAQGADARRRRPRFARRAVPRRGRRRHDRHRRHGRGRRVEPAAPDPAQPRPHRRPQGRLGEEDAHDAQPRRRRRHLRHPPRRAATSSTSSPATT